MKCNFYFSVILSILGAINLCLSHKISHYIPYELTWIIVVIGFSFLTLMCVGIVGIIVNILDLKKHDVSHAEDKQ